MYLPTTYIMNEATSPSLGGLVLICKKREATTCCSLESGNRHHIFNATLFPFVALHSKSINLSVCSSVHPFSDLPIHSSAHPAICWISIHWVTILCQVPYWEAIYFMVKYMDCSLKLPGVESWPWLLSIKSWVSYIDWALVSSSVGVGWELLKMYHRLVIRISVNLSKALSFCPEGIPFLFCFAFNPLFFPFFISSLLTSSSSSLSETQLVLSVNERVVFSGEMEG